MQCTDTRQSIKVCD